MGGFSELLRRGSLLFLAVAACASPFACGSSGGTSGPTGGGDAAGGARSGGTMNDGGAHQGPGDGGAPSGGISTGGNPAGLQGCDPSVSRFAGGAIFLESCPAWVKPGGPLADSCSEGGSGAQGGEGGQLSEGREPLVTKLCLAPTDGPLDINFSQPVLSCLKAEIEDPCSAGHDERVLGCLALPFPCVSKNFEACNTIMGMCPGIEGNLCYWGMDRAVGNPVNNEVRDPIQCLADESPGEDCRARFIRCVWGI